MAKKKMISVLLVVISLLSFCSFSSFAEDPGLDVNNFGYTASYVAPGAPSSTDITSEITKQIPSSGDVVRFDFPTLNTTPGVAASTYMTLNLLDGFVIRPDHEYTMSFSFGNRMQVRSKLDVYVIIYNSNGSQYGSKAVYSFDGSCANSTQTADFNFKIKSSELPDGYRTSLKLVYQSFWTNTSNAVPERFYISRYISVVDNDDNTGLLERIITAIKEIPSKIGTFFAEIKQQITDSYNGLVYNISQFKDNVKEKFDALVANIDHLGEKIRNWLSNLGDRIEQFFIDLGNDIGEFFTMLKNYLLYFQHPVTVNSDGVLIGADGKPVYTNPFQSSLVKMKDTFKEWTTKINAFVTDMEESRQNVTGYLENGSGLVNKVLKASPILTACIIFAAGFLVIRKVVGR